MGWDNFAPNYTRVAASQTDVAIGTAGTAGGTIRIYNISMSATGGVGTVTLEEFGTTTVIATYQVASGVSFTLGGNGFLCNKGLQVTTSSNVEVTIFHSNVGA
jgi:hypothetical protein